MHEEISKMKPLDMNGHATKFELNRRKLKKKSHGVLIGHLVRRENTKLAMWLFF
jgi:hypothetical protein